MELSFLKNGILLLTARDCLTNISLFLVESSILLITICSDREADQWQGNNRRI